jgi:hypothetical protein
MKFVHPLKTIRQSHRIQTRETFLFIMKIMRMATALYVVTYINVN